MINNTTVKDTYITNGDLNTVYPITFQGGVTEDGTPHLVVVLKPADEHATQELRYNIDYVIAEDALNVIGIKLLSEEYAANGNTLTITRNTPLEQNVDFQVGRIDPEQIEKSFDDTVLRDQELLNKVDIVLEIPEDHEERIQALEQDVDDINDLIPNQTSTENQLADKNFVNSSIATSTATFRGTYDTLEELEAVTADDNDYGFVVSVDAVGNTLYARYKYTTATDPASWVFEYYLNNSSFTADQWAAINSGVTKAGWDNVHSTNGYNIGDIFFTARTDTGLNGAVECNGGTYDGTDFIGAQNPVTLMADGKLPYVSLATYATLLSTQGSVGVFGWDGAGTTTFRVPSLNDVFIETGTAAEVGDYIPAGVPSASVTNIIGVRNNVVASGGFSVTDTGGASYTGGGSADTNVDKYTVALNQGVYKDDATTVQPETTRYRAMVQLAVAATDEAVMTCTNVAAQVAANTSAINGADYVVETQLPTALNNYTWYRKYKSGWVEQGGITSAVNGTAATTSVTLPVEMADVNYSLYVTITRGAQLDFRDQFLAAGNRSVTGFTVYSNFAGSGNGTTDNYGQWEVKGMAAQ